MSIAYDKHAWRVASDPSQPRATDGRFAEKAASAPEVTLADPEPGIHPGCRVLIGGSGPAYRVANVAGTTVVLKNLAGGNVVRPISQVTLLPEDVEQRERNLRVEAELTGVRASLKAASRQQRERLGSPPIDRTAMENAQDALARAVIDGHVDRDIWRMGDALSKGEPLGARNAIAAVVAREHVSPGDYQNLTQQWERVMGPLRS